MLINLFCSVSLISFFPSLLLSSLISAASASPSPSLLSLFSSHSFGDCLSPKLPAVAALKKSKSIRQASKIVYICHRFLHNQLGRYATFNACNVKNGFSLCILVSIIIK